MRFLLLSWIFLLTSVTSSAPVYTKELKSPVYRVDRIYKSMQGPSALQNFQLEQEQERELLWVVGYEAFVVEPLNGEPISQEFLCHANLDYQPDSYEATIGNQLPLDGRFFTLSQGQQEVVFPKGFGIPIYSDEPLTMVTQVLNLNDPKLDRDVSYRVKIRYHKDSELTTPMQALCQLAAFGMKAIGDDSSCAPSASDHGSSCAVGKAAMEGAEMAALVEGGPKMTGHWVVEPGREVNKTDVTALLALQEDLKVHYVAVHLHPYSESLELKDTTDDVVIFNAKVKPASGRVGIEHIDHFTSVEGFILKPGHEYTLTSVYNNTTEENVDSMAVMYLYGAVEATVKPPQSKDADR